MVLPIVTRDWVVVLVPENSEVKVLIVQDVDVSIEPEDTGIINRPP